MGKRTGIMLAYPFEERRLTSPKFDWRFPVLVQPKLDGERCRALVEGSRSVTLLSSEGNEITQLPHIENALLDLPFTGELDGELYSTELSFPEIHSIVSRKNDPHESHEMIGYYIFDEIFQEGREIRQWVRTRLLEDLAREFAPPLYLVPTYEADCLEEVFRIYRDCIEMGYEGIIVRHPDLVYVRKRTPWMLKFKPKKMDVYEIAGVFEAVSKEGESKGMLGGFTLFSPESGDTFDAGAGCLTHSERVRLWNERETLPGQDLLVQYQHTENMKPRFALAVEVQWKERRKE